MNNWRKAIEQYKKENKEKLGHIEFYTINDVMQILNIKHKKIINNWIKIGKLKPYNIDNKQRFQYYFDKEYINGLKI
jgi:hypothetical protein